MKIKKMIIVCAIIICVLICMILIIAGTQQKKGNVSDSIESSNEALEMAALETEEEESGEEITLTIRNTTGKTIDDIYFYGDEIDEDGNIIGRSVMDNPLKDGDSAEVEIINYNEDTKWDIAAIMGSKDYEMEYTIGSDFVCDGAVIILGLQDGNLIIVEEVENEEEELDEEEYLNEENSNEENEENTEDTEEENNENIENEEENN